MIPLMCLIWNPDLLWSTSVTISHFNGFSVTSWTDLETVLWQNNLTLKNTHSPITHTLFSNGLFLWSPFVLKCLSIDYAWHFFFLICLSLFKQPYFTFLFFCIFLLLMMLELLEVCCLTCLKMMWCCIFFFSSSGHFDAWTLTFPLFELGLRKFFFCLFFF